MCGCMHTCNVPIIPVANWQYLTVLSHNRLKNTNGLMPPLWAVNYRATLDDPTIILPYGGYAALGAFLVLLSAPRATKHGTVVGRYGVTDEAGGACVPWTHARRGTARGLGSGRRRRSRDPGDAPKPPESCLASGSSPVVRRTALGLRSYRDSRPPVDWACTMSAASGKPPSRGCAVR